jgi:hypothetical protein
LLVAKKNPGNNGVRFLVLNYFRRLTLVDRKARDNEEEIFRGNGIYYVGTYKKNLAL